MSEEIEYRVEASLDSPSLPKPKRGRPPMPDADRKRNNLTFRARDALRADLERAAAENGRSVSEEIEYRLEASRSTTPLRDRFAAQALNGMAQSAGFQGAPWEKLAKDAYLAADAMLAQRTSGSIGDDANGVDDCTRRGFFTSTSNGARGGVTLHQHGDVSHAAHAKGGQP